LATFFIREDVMKNMTLFCLFLAILLTFSTASAADDQPDADTDSSIAMTLNQDLYFPCNWSKIVNSQIREQLLFTKEMCKKCNGTIGFSLNISSDGEVLYSKLRLTTGDVSADQAINESLKNLKHVTPPPKSIIHNRSYISLISWQSCNIFCMLDSCKVGSKQESGKEEEIYKIKDSALKGDAKSQYELGLEYEKGNSLQLDYSEAFKWFKKAAGQDYPDAQLEIGYYYLVGMDVPVDYSQAMNWFKKAADKSPQALNEIGVMYLNGKGVPVNSKEAVSYFSKAADKNNAYAQFNIANMYERGCYFKKDYKEAFNWYLKAANNGHTVAQCDVARFYLKGRVVQKDYIESFKWYLKAAESGLPVAQVIVAKSYEKGIGVPKDDIKAYMWYFIAASEYNVEAMDNLHIIKGKLNDSQLKEACKLISEFKPKKDDCCK
jgi:TPR repeat protein